LTGVCQAGLQLAMLWEEILRRDLQIEVLGEPMRAVSNFIRGIKELPVRAGGGGGADKSCQTQTIKLAT
jgi:hypothetical protein